MRRTTRSIRGARIRGSIPSSARRRPIHCWSSVAPRATRDRTAPPNSAAPATSRPIRRWSGAGRPPWSAWSLKCHSGQVTVDQGDRITKAMSTVELYGCYSCHKISNWRFTDLRKPGPDLNGIAEKTTPEWAIRWISEPHNFRSTTRMPSFFYQRNMIDPRVVPAAEITQNVKFQDAEIHAIVSYLFAKSTHRVWQAPTQGGDAARGMNIVESGGC